MNVERIREENEKFAPRPDLVIILDLPPDTGLERITNYRKEDLNYFETLDYQGKVRELFLGMRNYDNVRILDAGGSVDEVQEEIRRVVEEVIASLLE